MTRYTEFVGWNLRTISVAMLAVLSILPVSRVLCMLACEPTAAAEVSAHHGGVPCDEHAEAAPEQTAAMSHAPDHDCRSHEAVALEATLTAADRQQASPVFAGSQTLLVAGYLGTTASAVLPPGHRSQVPGSAPPRTTSLPLRI